MMRRMMRRSFSRLTMRMQSTESQATSKPKLTPGDAVLVAPIVATTCLGVWQVQRLGWKRELIAARDAQLAAPPFDLEIAPVIEDEADARELEYNKVLVKGQVDDGVAVFLGPRSPQAHVPSAMKIGKTVTGYHLIQPLTLESGRRILINRGWVRKDDKGHELATLPVEHSFIGIVRCSEAPMTHISFVMDRQTGSIDFLWRDVVGMAEQLKTEPICVDAIYDLGMDGNSGPDEGSSRLSRHVYEPSHQGRLVPFKADLKHYLNIRTPPEQHMAYAFTWFTLTAIMSFMAFKRVRVRFPK